MNCSAVGIWYGNCNAHTKCQVAERSEMHHSHHNHNRTCARTSFGVVGGREELWVYSKAYPHEDKDTELSRNNQQSKKKVKRERIKKIVEEMNLHKHFKIIHPISPIIILTKIGQFDVKSASPPCTPEHSTADGCQKKRLALPRWFILIVVHKGCLGIIC